MKYIRLKISKGLGFRRYKFEVGLNLQAQIQAPLIKMITIRGKFDNEIVETELDKKEYSITLIIADSKLYLYEDPVNIGCTNMCVLCPYMYLIEPYCKGVEFYLEYDVDISKIIDVFKSLDDEIDRMVQAPGTPAFDYVLTGAKYIKLRISKKVGFWRYRVEVGMNQIPQIQASHIKEININGVSSYRMTETGVRELHNSIDLDIADSILYLYEHPGDYYYTTVYDLYPSIYLKKSYRQGIVFYLKYDVNINKVVNAFKKLDNVIDRKVRASSPNIICI